MMMMQRDAMQYADHATRAYQYSKFKKKYPELFESYVEFETRPADSKEDYYVPHSIRDKCIVVSRLAWNLHGCSLVSCFPFKAHDEPCVANVDGYRWTLVDDELYVPACQPACERGLLLETRYRDGDCFVLNTLKKLYAMRQRLKYDPVNDKLRIGPHYCWGYGMEYDGGDCYVSAGQYVAELFWGTTVFRRYFLKPLQDSSSDPPPPPLDDLHTERRRELYERVWERVPKRDRTVIDPVHVETTTMMMKPGTIAAEVAAELGVQVVERSAKKISERLARKILVDKGLKRAFFRSAGALPSVALAAYGIGSFVVDVVDPYEYGSVLDRERVAEIDRTLDSRFFQTDKNLRLTPEHVWNFLQDEEEFEDELSYCAERFEEYLEALKTVPEQQPKWEERRKRSGGGLVVVMILVLMALSLVRYVEYIGAMLVVYFALR